MTGFQPTAASKMMGDDGNTTQPVVIADLVRACNVTFVKVADPYEHEVFRSILRKAYDHSQSPTGGVAVVIADHPCVLYDPLPVSQNPMPVLVAEECDGCHHCVEAFACPALVLRPDSGQVNIDYKICVECGQCIDACPKNLILPRVTKITGVEM
jgi:indolepyruvate ferredoxin oxidoreductase alpha subunit